MGGDQFDRQIFGSVPPPPRPSFSLVGPGLLLAVIGLGGFAAYKYITTKGVVEAGNGKVMLDQIDQRLKSIEQRLDRVEKHRKSAAVDLASAPTNEGDRSHHPGVSSRVLQTKSTDLPRADSSTLLPSSPQPNVRTFQPSQELRSLRAEVTATRQESDAATDRLGTVVGELSSQQEEIRRNRQDLSQIVDRLQRSILPFELQTRGGRLRVGPVWLWLRSTDPANQRFSMRVLVNDKWTELKDRTLHEAVNLYTPASQLPVELVVTDIKGGQVRGRIAVPPDAEVK